VETKKIPHLTCGYMTHPSSGQLMSCFFAEGDLFECNLFLI